MLTYYFFKRIKMVAEGFSACLGKNVQRIRLFTDERFMDLDITQLFQSGNMTCQVAVGNLQQVFQLEKGNIVIDHQYGHDAQPYAVLKCLIKILYNMLHRLLILLLV